MSAATTKTANNDVKKWVHYFRVPGGKRYRLFKRQPGMFEPWQIDCIVKGKRIQRSLDTNNAAAAAKRAELEYIVPALRGQSIEASKLRSDYAALGKIEDTYRAEREGKGDDRTVWNNILALRLVVRRALDNDAMSENSHRALSSTVLTAKLVGDFENWMCRSAKAEGRNLESNKASVNSYLRQARSIFKRAMMQRYEELGLHLPDLKPFMTRVTEKPIKKEKLPPPDDLLQRTLKASEQLRVEDPPAYIAWILGFSTLRRSEVGRMEWTWREEQAGLPAVRVPCISKGRRERVVTLDPAVAEELDHYKAVRCVGRNPEQERFVLPSKRPWKEGRKLRASSVFRRVDTWMRSLGWTTNHTLHEMRALGGRLFKRQYGLDATQVLLGHKERRTTVESYAGETEIHGLAVHLPLPPRGETEAEATNASPKVVVMPAEVRRRQALS